MTQSRAMMILLAEYIRGGVMRDRIGVIRHFPVLQIPVIQRQHCRFVESWWTVYFGR